MEEEWLCYGGGHFNGGSKVWVFLGFFLRIYLLETRNLLWDILRLPSSHRAALGLDVILTL